MSLIIQQNTPTIVDLANEARSTGWSINSGVAHHETCNDGIISLRPDFYSILEGLSYTISYTILNYVSGTVQLHIGDTLGAVRTSNGEYVETLTATGDDPLVYFFSNGNLDLVTFNIRDNTSDISIKQRNTIAYDENNNKWGSYFSYTSELGFSMFTDLFTVKEGRIYKHDPDKLPRNNIYGIQYQTVINLPFNVNQGQPKTFESLSYESNMLLITTTDGIKTSLGQVSELIDDDFIQQTLVDGATNLVIYDREGIYSASFKRDKREDINFGSVLKGTFITVELITTATGQLKLKNVVSNSVPSKIGTR